MSKKYLKFIKGNPDPVRMDYPPNIGGIDTWGTNYGLYFINDKHTGFSADTGIVNAISYDPILPPWKAFDGINDTGYQWNKNSAFASGDWLTYSFYIPRIVEKISLSWAYAGLKTVEVYYTINGIDYILDSTFSETTTSLTIYEHHLTNNTLLIMGLKYVFTAYAGSVVTTLTESVIYSKQTILGDTYKDGRWYDKDNNELPPQTYATYKDKLVAFNIDNGKVYDIEYTDIDIPKITEDIAQFKTIISDDYKGKGAVSVKGHYDITVNPPYKKREGLNNTGLIRTGGTYGDDWRLYFEKPMKTLDYFLQANGIHLDGSGSFIGCNMIEKHLDYVEFRTMRVAPSATNTAPYTTSGGCTELDIVVIGGK